MQAETLQIGTDFAIPADRAGTQKFAFIGQSGAGKTYAAGKLVEELLRVGARVIVLDIVGNWYGLTIAADGKGRGFQIPVFGGSHADVPIDPAQGAAVARLLVERDLSGVIDISRFRKGERTRFVTAFAEELFHLAQTRPTQRMLVCEEMQRLAPQNARDGEARMLGAMEDLVRLGRNYSIGCVMISQRPQSINKEVLNQATCLFVGQLSGSHERKAIEQWVTENDNADRGWLKELPQLTEGTMHVWSPAWLKTRRKVRIARKTTYDASATLELGEVRATRKPLEAVDVEALRAELEVGPPGVPVMPKAKADPDPLVPQLRGRIAALEVQRDSIVEHLRLMGQELQRLLASVEATIRVTEGYINSVPPYAEVQAENVLSSEAAADRAGAETATAGPPRRLLKRYPQTAAKLARAPAAPANGASVPAGQIRILTALANFHPGTVTRGQAAKLGKTAMSGGTFRRYWGTLRALGFIEEPEPGQFRASREGLKAVGKSPAPVPPTFEARLAMWEERLTAGERAILHEVLRHKRPVQAESVADAVGKALSGGTFRRYVGTLVTNRLIQKTEKGMEPHPWLLGAE